MRSKLTSDQSLLLSSPLKIINKQLFPRKMRYWFVAFFGKTTVEGIRWLIRSLETLIFMEFSMCFGYVAVLFRSFINLLPASIVSIA